MTIDTILYILIPLAIIIAILCMKAHVNIRLHTMFAIGFVCQGDVKTTYIYIGPILIKVCEIKSKSRKTK